MVVQKTIDNLKERPKDEKTAVAGGIAITVVLILFIGWGFLFIKKIQKGGELRDLGSGAQEEFNFSSVKEAQKQLQDNFQYTADELRKIRESAVSDQPSVEPQPVGGDVSDPQFGVPEE